MAGPWYIELYRYFPDYDREPYVQNTAQEVEFIEREIGHDRSKLILDVGCGTGRHAFSATSADHTGTFERPPSGRPLAQPLFAAPRLRCLPQMMAGEGERRIQGRLSRRAFSSEIVDSPFLGSLYTTGLLQ